MNRALGKILSVLLLALIASWGFTARAAQTGARLVNGVELAYEVKGQGPPLLMIMGYAGAMQAWEPRLLNALARDFTLILYDHRGMGLSGKWDKPVSLKMLAQDALGLLDSLGYAKANVLGWSMGSMIAQEMALARPERVQRLVLYGTVYDNKPVMKALKAMGKATPKEFKAMMFPGPWLEKHPDAFKRLPHVSTRPSAAAVAAQAKALALWPGTEKRLPGLAASTLLIAGGADEITPQDHALRMTWLIPGSWLARYADGGHWLMYQYPLDMARLIKAFLLPLESRLRRAPALMQGGMSAKAA